MRRRYRIAALVAALVGIIAIGNWASAQVVRFRRVEQTYPSLMRIPLTVLIIDSADDPSESIHTGGESEQHKSEGHSRDHFNSRHEAIRSAAKFGNVGEMRFARDKCLDVNVKSGQLSRVDKLHDEWFVGGITYVPQTEPRALFSLKNVKLPLRNIGLSLGLGGERSKVGNGVFQVGGVGGGSPSEERDNQRAESDKKSQPFVNRKAAKKIEGVCFAMFATGAGVAGAVWLMGAVDGREFGLCGRARLRCAGYAALAFLFAFLILDRWAAPLLVP